MGFNQLFPTSDAKLFGEKSLQLPHGGVELVMERGALGTFGQGEGIRHTVGE